MRITILGSMRALFLLALLPAVAPADILQFDFTGQVNNVPGFPNLWNGPGPIPSTFEMSFLVNTLAPGNSLQYTPHSPCVFPVSIGVVAYGFNVTVDGKNIGQGGTGSFGVGGSGLGPCSYIGGGYGASSPFLSFIGVPDFSFGNATLTALQNSTDPLSTLLNGSHYNNDGGDNTYLNYGSSRLTVEVSGGATSVPEPGPLSLLALGLLGVALRGRKKSGVQRQAA